MPHLGSRLPRRPAAGRRTGSLLHPAAYRAWERHTDLAPPVMMVVVVVVVMVMVMIVIGLV